METGAVIIQTAKRTVWLLCLKSLLVRNRQEFKYLQTKINLNVLLCSSLPSCFYMRSTVVFTFIIWKNRGRIFFKNLHFVFCWFQVFQVYYHEIKVWSKCISTSLLSCSNNHIEGLKGGESLRGYFYCMPISSIPHERPRGFASVILAFCIFQLRY